ncbi:MAG TPA: hypothetical protein VK402_06735 [Blastococcus sp.]|nr:hypothetical protein [Blastococcus sp.]
MSGRGILVAACSAAAVLIGGSSAAASEGTRGCVAQADHSGELRSPACTPAGDFLPPREGITENHNETLVRDAG